MHDLEALAEGFLAMPIKAAVADRRTPPMPTRLIIAPAAGQALDDIFDSICAESPQAARRFAALLASSDLV